MDGCKQHECTSKHWVVFLKIVDSKFYATYILLQKTKLEDWSSISMLNACLTYEIHRFSSSIEGWGKNLEAKKKKKAGREKNRLYKEMTVTLHNISQQYWKQKKSTVTSSKIVSNQKTRVLRGGI